MKEIGGYFEFEKLISNELYSNLYAFNSARNCLRYILRKRDIKKIYLPYFLCEVIEEACSVEGVEISYYNINKEFMPIVDSNNISPNCYLYIINHYGVLNNDTILNLYNKYRYIIIDNTHAFFQNSIDGIDTIYNCRKYFGVADGAYLFTDLELDCNLETSKSGFRINHLIGRLEENGSKYYEDFKKADLSFHNEDIMFMSKFTKNMMGAIDYGNVLRIRKENFSYLHSKLSKYNKLSVNDNMNFMYPLYIDDAEKLRNILISNKIFIPILWPNVLKLDKNMLEYNLVKNTILIPIDQRYSINDMDRIIKIIEENI